MFRQVVARRVLSSFPSPPSFWKRYVDDVFTVLEPSIQFTCEMEKDGSLPFLDVEVMHTVDGSLSTKVYRKRTHTDKYLDFASHHTLRQKCALARTLLLQAQRLCRSSSDISAEEQHVTTALERNGYPRPVIQWSRPRLPSCHPPVDRSTTDPAATVVIPYISSASEAVRRILSPINIRTCFCLNVSLRDILTRAKDAVDPEKKAGVIYKIPCGGCSQAYVGQTGRSLSHRAKEHLRACRNGDTELSAVAEHAWSSGHAVAWDDMTVLDRSSRLHEHCTLEAWHIRSQPHPINRERGRLSGTYDILLPRRH